MKTLIDVLKILDILRLSGSRDEPEQAEREKVDDLDETQHRRSEKESGGSADRN